MQAKRLWFSKFGYPSVIGAIDCTHIKIRKPSQANFGDEYINRKGFASINVQVVCDKNCKIINFDASNPGSVHDQRIFTNSVIYQHLLHHPNNVLLGDEGYSLTPFLMVPFHEPNELLETNFNKKHTLARLTIEHTFGQVKSRFPMLQCGLRLKLETIPIAIACAFILHNVAKYLNDADDFEVVEEEEVPIIAQVHDPLLSLREKGEQKRFQIAQILM